jgi:phosphoribosylformimino-5-aminoimidazole carboxamide ribotide isomerase
VDPVETAKSFRQAGAEWMHVVDLDGAKEGRPVQTELIARMIAASGLKVEVGGGIRSAEDIRRLLDAGAERVVLGTKAMEDWAWFESQVREARFANRLVLAVDAKEGVIAVKGWMESSGKQAADVARQVSDWPLGAILYTDVAKDGMMTGPNYEQTRRLVEAGRVPVIASGGVGTIDHVREAKKTGAWGCIIGRSLYEGTVDLREAIAMGS